MREYDRGKVSSGSAWTDEDEERSRKEQEIYDEMIKADPRFSRKTYYFIERAFNHGFFLGMGNMEDATNTPDGKPREKGQVAAPDLCYAAAEYAAKEYGRLAKIVLARMGLRTTSDIGDAVYNMIRFGLITKSKYDERSDFDNVFDLREEIDRIYKRERQYVRRNKRWLP